MVQLLERSNLEAARHNLFDAVYDDDVMITYLMVCECVCAFVHTRTAEQVEVCDDI